MTATHFSFFRNYEKVKEVVKVLELHPIVKAKVYRCDYRDCKYNDCGQCSKKEVEVILYNDNKARCGSFEG